MGNFAHRNGLNNFSHYDWKVRYRPGVEQHRLITVDQQERIAMKTGFLVIKADPEDFPGDSCCVIVVVCGHDLFFAPAVV